MSRSRHPALTDVKSPFFLGRHPWHVPWMDHRLRYQYHPELITRSFPFLISEARSHVHASSWIFNPANERNKISEQDSVRSEPIRSADAGGGFRSMHQNSGEDVVKCRDATPLTHHWSRFTTYRSSKAWTQWTARTGLVTSVLGAALLAGPQKIEDWYPISGGFGALPVQLWQGIPVPSHDRAPRMCFMWSFPHSTASIKPVKIGWFL